MHAADRGSARGPAPGPVAHLLDLALRLYFALLSRLGELDWGDGPRPACVAAERRRRHASA